MWGDVLGGLGEVFGRKKPRKNVEKTYKITLLIPTPIFAVLNFYFFHGNSHIISNISQKLPAKFLPSPVSPSVRTTTDDVDGLTTTSTD